MESAAWFEFFLEKEHLKRLRSRVRHVRVAYLTQAGLVSGDFV